MSVHDPLSSKLSTNLLLNAEYCEESHIQAFADALAADELYLDNQDASSPNTPAASPVTLAPTRVQKVSALSDFAPVNLKVKRRRRKDRLHDRRRDWLFLLLRWPLLEKFFIFVFIAIEFGFYVIIRQVVNTKEWFTAWRGRKGILRKKLRAARTYEEWKEAAETLDQYLNFHEWKKVDDDPFYDWKLVKKVRRSLITLREKKDTRGCLGVLETCIRANFAGVESSRLYSETFLGTKDLIESYFVELEKTLVFIRETPELSVDEKKRFFKSANTNLGKFLVHMSSFSTQPMPIFAFGSGISALCLSGGASFGYYHCGVVKAFLDADLLPRVVTGTSAGGLIAALVCTRTSEELRLLLVPELANRITACEEPYRIWLGRLWKTGARFDSVLWAKKCTFFTRGSMTFKEAYIRTGRILNISVIPTDRHSPTKLLNYMTAPDTLIWTALLASAAVPGILNPVVLLQKLKDGSVVPWNWGSKFKDGSLRVDIPLQALNLYFNVTHPVVSQVNPHVHLFFFAPRGSAGKPVAHRKGKGWRGNFLLSAAEQWLKHELSKNFKVIRDLELLPQLLGQDWSSVFLQRFDGAVTIWPKTRLWDWFRLLSDPDSSELERMIRVGESVTWPKLHMIQNRARIEKQIYLGRELVRRTLKGGTLHSETLLMPLPSVAPPSDGSPVTPPSQMNSDYPLPVDPDAEAAFKQGSPWFFKRGHASASSPDGMTPKLGPVNDPFYSSSTRRKRTSVSGFANQSPPTSGQYQRTRSLSGSLLSRFKTRSFSSLVSSTADDTRQPSGDSIGRSLSNTSSSEDDYLEDRRQLRPSSFTNMEIDLLLEE